MLWNTPEYHEIGAFQDNWTVKISDLNLRPENSTIRLTVQFYLYYYNYFIPINYILDEISLEISKRDISCQLIGFPNVLKHGEILTFQARFYDTLSNNSNYLIDQKIECKLIANNKYLLNKSFTINSSGIIEISFNTLNISGNQNYLIFSIKDNGYYMDSEFEYEIIMEADPIDSRIEDPIVFNILPFFSIPVFLVISMAIVFLDKNKKSKHRKLIDITIRY